MAAGPRVSAEGPDSASPGYATQIDPAPSSGPREAANGGDAGCGALEGGGVLVDRQGSKEAWSTPQQVEDSQPSKLELDEAGRITKREILSKIEAVRIRADFLVERIEFESNMLFTMVKAGNFAIYFVFFLLALSTFAPAAAFNKVHNAIHSNYGLASTNALSTFEDVYNFIASFEAANERAQATSTHFWCEERYFNIEWDVHLGIPERRCRSPRQNALGSPQYSAECHHCHAVPWTPSSVASNASSASHATDTAHSSAHSGSSRRLKMEELRRLRNRRLKDGVPCEDHDDLLLSTLHHLNSTCSQSAAHVCNLEVGLLACEATCGYCPPFKYHRTLKAETAILAILPVVIYQKRYEPRACTAGEYAGTYNAQPVNPLLVMLPALDGNKYDKPFPCVDRTSLGDDRYAVTTDCPRDECPDGIFKDTAFEQFQGESVYPKMLIEPKKDIQGMKNVEWLDGQTESLTLSTMIYTEGSEIFTLLKVTISLDRFGKMSTTSKMMSYKELISGENRMFTICMCVVIVFSFLGICHSIMLLKRDAENRNFFNLFELGSRFAIFFFSLYFICSWAVLPYMHDEFDELLKTFLALRTDHSHLEESMREAQSHVFEVMSHIYAELAWVFGVRITAFLMLYIQWVQIILYFNVHPRMGILSRTMIYAFSNIIHFLTLFTIVFCLLGFFAYWMLGPDLAIFGTVNTALQSMVRMLFGEWIYSDGVDDLAGDMRVVYWIWAATFMLVVFFILLNFFLAIVVDAFCKVKEEIEENVTACSFPFDVFDAYASPLKWKKAKWPSRQSVAKVLDTHIPKRPDGMRKTSAQIAKEEDDEPLISVAELCEAFQSREEASAFVAYYGEKINAIVSIPQAEEDEVVDFSPQGQVAALVLDRGPPLSPEEQREAFTAAGEKALREFVRGVCCELQEFHAVDWEVAQGRLSCHLSRECSRARVLAI